MTLIEELRKGSRLALSRILSQVESSTTLGEQALDKLFVYTGNAHKIGITGPPGSGKSTLVNAIAHQIRLSEPDAKVAIIAVDPTSPLYRRRHPRRSRAHARPAERSKRIHPFYGFQRRIGRSGSPNAGDEPGL